MGHAIKPWKKQRGIFRKTAIILHREETVSQKLSSFYSMNLFFPLKISKYNYEFRFHDFNWSPVSLTHTLLRTWDFCLLLYVKTFLKKTKVHSMVHQFKFLLMKVTNQPIISQELHVVKHVIMIKMPCWSSNWTTEWERKVI